MCCCCPLQVTRLTSFATLTNIIGCTSQLQLIMAIMWVTRMAGAQRTKQGKVIVMDGWYTGLMQQAHTSQLPDIWGYFCSFFAWISVCHSFTHSHIGLCWRFATIFWKKLAFIWWFSPHIFIMYCRKVVRKSYLANIPRGRCAIIT